MLISIITINYNNDKGLKKTMKSVLEQNYAAIQYIIIDGNSSDQSVSLIKEYENDISYWVSEPDNGIYDAMNKGIKHADGSYILFLNSGDWLYNDRVISDFVASDPQEDFLYGNAMLVYDDKPAVKKQMPKKLDGTTLFSQTVTHQAMFHKKRLFKKQQFDIRFTMIADWVFYNSAIHFENASFRYLNRTIVNYDMSGFSSDQENRAIIETEREQFYAEHSNYMQPLRNQYNAEVESYYATRSQPLLMRWAARVQRKLKRNKSGNL